MTTRATIVKVIDDYCRTETEKLKAEWLALFADDIVHEDPVGRRINRGLEQLETLWNDIAASEVELFLTEPVIVCGNEAIAMMRCRYGPPGNRVESERIVDHFGFDETGKINSVRAFYEF